MWSRRGVCEKRKQQAAAATKGIQRAMKQKDCFSITEKEKAKRKRERIKHKRERRKRKNKDGRCQPSEKNVMSDQIRWRRTLA